MRRNVILAVIIIVAGIGGMLWFLYVQSLHKVSLTFDSEVKGVTIYAQNTNNEIKKVSASGDTSLQNGEYYIIPSGDKLSQSHIGFTVKDQDVTLTLDPDYSTDILAVEIVNNKTKIETAAKTAFPLISKQYSLQSETLLHRGEWFGAIVAKNVEDPRDQPDYYRILLRKEGDDWKVVNSPVLVLTKADFKNVPANVIDAVNKLTQ